MKRKAILAVSLLLVTVLFLSGCAPKKTPYEINDQENYTVSVKYDANGGEFHDNPNTSVIVDSYNVSDMATNAQGQVEIPLLPTNDPGRGEDASEPTKSGYFLAGWYSQRTEIKDEAGNITYSYEGKWDFEKDRLTIDPNGDYHSAEPQLTLYAAWVPLFEIKFCALDTGKEISTIEIDPTDQVLLPVWDETTGLLRMNKFPEREGSTFKGAFYDEKGTQPVTTEAVIHPGTVDTATGIGSNLSMNLYLDYMEGEWYHIYNVKQFKDNASLKGNYILQADLDFSEEIWPTSLMYGNFTGTIEGKGHTIKNINLEQTDSSKVNAGIFGNLTEEASIKNVTFDNASLTIKTGARKEGTRYGLFAGTIAESAVLEGVTVTNSKLQIDSGCHFEANDYSIGLVCGMGSDTKLDHSGITCIPVGDAPEKVNITVNGNTVTLEISK